MFRILKIFKEDFANRIKRTRLFYHFVQTSPTFLHSLINAIEKMNECFIC